MADFQFYLNRQGIKGRKGDTGDAGFSPIISVKTATANEYILNIQNEGGSFETPNLRGNAIENQGGTYIRYNPSTSAMYTGYADIASTSQYGEVILSDYNSLEAGGSENTVPNSEDVYNFVINKIAEETFDFSKLAQSLIAGQNITFDVNNENKTITINANTELEGYVTESELAETLEDYATIASVEADLAEKQDIITAHAPLYFDEAPASISNYTYNSNTDAYDLDNGSGTVQFSGKYNSSSTVEVTYNNAANLAAIVVPYEYGQIFRLFKGYSEEPDAHQRIASGFGYIYNNFPIYSIGNVDFPSSTSWSHRCKLVDDSLIRTAIDGYSGSTDLSVGDVSTTNVASITENSEIYGQLLYDEQSDVYTINLYDKYSGSKYQTQFGFNDSQYSILSRIDKYIITIDSSLPKSKGVYYTGTDVDLYTISANDFDNLSFNNIFTNSGSTSQGTELYIDTSNIASVQSFNDLAEDVSNISADLTTHTSNTSNPHSVTKAQIGLGNVDNTSDLDKPISTAAQAALDDKADANLGNLDSNGEKRLHALKGYLEEVEPLTDSEGYNNLTKGLNSTFDLSKFTVVGSPNITDDGIASGLGNNNYFNTGIIIGQKPFKIRAEVNYANTVSGQRIFQVGLGTGVTLNIYTQVSGSNPTQLRVSGTLSDDTTFSDGIADISGNVIAEAIFTGSAYILNAYSINGTLLGTKTVSNSNLYIKNVDTSKLLIGTNATDIIYDLKQFSITVEGVEVFNGNKTGIDVIKPDDYTVVGTPTISADGVASGFSLSDYLRTPTIDFTKPFIIDFWYKMPSVFAHAQVPISWGSNDYNYIRAIINETRLAIGGNVRDTKYKALQANTLYHIVISWDSSTYSAKIYTETGELYIDLSYESNTASASNSPLTIGKSAWDASNASGSIDLNTFKIYVGGNLVYQPCLKIPYTESIYGDRITYIQYLPRVQDAFNQTGNCDEAVIDTENQVYYLPAGNIYGKLNKSLGDISTILDSISGEVI